MANGVPFLCGGTFFTQLLRMKKSPSRSRTDGLTGEKDKVNNQRMLEALIRFFKPDFMVYSDNTFKGDTSDYKSCKESQGDNLPFDESRTDFSYFDNLVKKQYKDVLPLMKQFVDRFINTDDEKKVSDAVKALLQTIADDKSIDDNAEFFMGAMGNPLTKAELANRQEIILEPFLLGVWHFILLHRPVNTDGRNTFLAWHQAPSRELRGKGWKYISKIGKSYPEIYLHRSDEDFAFEKAVEELPDEMIEEDEETYESTTDDSPVTEAYNQVFLLQQQILNNHGVINNWHNAPGGIQVAHIENLTITWGKK